MRPQRRFGVHIGFGFEVRRVILVVYSEGPDGSSYPYGVFTSKEAAWEAREAIIAELDQGHREVLDDEELTLAHQLAGTLDEQIQIERCELRSEFLDDDLDDLFKDV
jgi:hypothetical protein